MTPRNHCWRCQRVVRVVNTVGYSTAALAEEPPSLRFQRITWCDDCGLWIRQRPTMTGHNELVKADHNLVRLWRR